MAATIQTAEVKIGVTVLASSEKMMLSMSVGSHTASMSALLSPEQITDLAQAVTDAELELLRRRLVKHGAVGP